MLLPSPNLKTLSNQDACEDTILNNMCLSLGFLQSNTWDNNLNAGRREAGLEYMEMGNAEGIGWGTHRACYSMSVDFVCFPWILFFNNGTYRWQANPEGAYLRVKTSHMISDLCYSLMITTSAFLLSVGFYKRVSTKCHLLNKYEE